MYTHIYTCGLLELLELCPSLQEDNDHPTDATPSSCWSYILLKNTFIFHKIINSYQYNAKIIYYYNYNDQINNSCK